MALDVAEEELYRACSIIFGKDLKVSRDFLQYLQLSGIKKAYRKKALEIHPDRGGYHNLTLQQNMAHQFIDVHEAYKNLVAYLEARDNRHGQKDFPAGFSAPHRAKTGSESSGNPPKPDSNRFFRQKPDSHRATRKNGSQQGGASSDIPLDPKSLYRGPIPDCPLLFGRYLYYSGVISLHTIGQALIWQRSQKPRLGEIGKRLGWLSEQDTLRILRNKRDRQLFGELALRLGILTREQLHLILLQQKRLHKRIGQYFVEKNYWDAALLEKYIAAHARHNARVRNLFA